MTADDMASNKSQSKLIGPLTVEDHRRDAAGMKYVYPVLSRRAGGVSLGINLNVNNACNWACIYCQVPDLVRGGPPPVDLAQLERELGSLLDHLTAKSAVDRVANDLSLLADLAFSGNGEPTSAEDFPEAVDVVMKVLENRGLLGALPIRVISNGSLMHRESVRRALARIGTVGGEIWFKVDRVTECGMQRVNQTMGRPEVIIERLRLSANAAPTWIQTCWFGIDGKSPDATEFDAYLRFVERVAPLIQGVHLYGIARPSMQADAGRLVRLDPEVMRDMGDRIKEKGLTVTVSP